VDDGCRAGGVYPEKPSVLTLIERCQAGDPAAWEEIVRAHNGRIYGLCYRFTGSTQDAQDLTQEVFVKTYRSLERFDPAKAAFGTWLTAIARNALVDHFRRTKQERLTDSLDAAVRDDDDGPVSASEVVDTHPSPHESLARRDLQKRVQAALQTLAPEFREVVILRDLQDLDYAEIAAALNLPVGTVKSRISRGRAELGRILSRNNRQVQSR
jgi:RNA polymerase sigma-70 factor, ECF subfamily